LWAGKYLEKSVSSFVGSQEEKGGKDTGEKCSLCLDDHIDIKPIYDEDKDMGSNSKHVLNPWKSVAQ
jgi:hypothetical protein